MISFIFQVLIKFTAIFNDFIFFEKIPYVRRWHTVFDMKSIFLYAIFFLFFIVFVFFFFIFFFFSFLFSTFILFLTRFFLFIIVFFFSLIFIFFTILLGYCF